MNRFFVKVHAPTKAKVRALQSYDLDLFQSTVTQLPDGRYAISGLLTLDKVRRLVLDGYQVVVEEESTRRSRGPREVVEFEEWFAARSKG